MNLDSDLKTFVRVAEADYIKNVLIHNNWQIGESSKVLGIHRSMLYRKMQEYEISKK